MEQNNAELRHWKRAPQRIVLADNQVIFRTGAARVVSTEPDLEVAAQCTDIGCLKETLHSHQNCIVVFPSTISVDVHGVLDCIERAGCKAVVIVDHGEDLDDTVARRASGVLLRSVTGAQLVECLRRVAAGERCVQRAVVKAMPLPDRTGARVLERLTPKEMQIVALVSEGCKNKEIASRLATKEQVVKNYLRTIYDKTGVSDRLELALFTLHHRALAEAAEQVRAQFAKSA